MTYSIYFHLLTSCSLYRCPPVLTLECLQTASQRILPQDVAEPHTLRGTVVPDYSTATVMRKRHTWQDAADKPSTQALDTVTNDHKSENCGPFKKGTACWLYPFWHLDSV